MFKKVNIIAICFILQSCFIWPKPQDTTLSYQMESITIVDREYDCVTARGVNTSARDILAKLAYLTAPDLNRTMQDIVDELVENKVGICYLPMYIYKESCSGLLAVGCYNGYKRTIWLTANALVHELVHHYIEIIDPHGVKESYLHTHYFQKQYEPLLNKEFGL